MKSSVYGLLITAVILFMGCGSSSNNTDYSATGQCSDSVVDGNMITIHEVNTSGAILFDCNTSQFSIGGAEGMNVTNRTFETLGTKTFNDGSTWEGNESFNELEGVYHVVGEHSVLGSYDCIASAVSNLPQTIDNSNPDLIEEVILDYDTSSTGSTCPPEWLDDGTLDDEVLASVQVNNYTLTDDKSNKHAISTYSWMTHVLANKAVIEHELAADTTFRVTPENIVMLDLEHPNAEVDTNDTGDVIGTDCFSYLHDEHMTVYLSVDQNSSIGSVTITNKTSDETMSALAGEASEAFVLEADQEYEMCVSHDSLTPENRAVFSRLVYEAPSTGLRFAKEIKWALKWTKNCNHCDLSYKTITGFILKKADLKYANFQHSYIDATVFDYASLENANFEHASFCNTWVFLPIPVTFNHANLQGAIFDHANAVSTHFKSANIYGASFKETRFLESSFDNAFADRAIFEKAVIKGTDFIGANLGNKIMGSGIKFKIYSHM